MIDISDLAEHLAGYAERAFANKDRDELERVLTEYFDDGYKRAMQDGWISTSERSPIKDGYYLVSCKGGNVHIDFSLCGKWDNKYEYKIIAWQSLPEPYKEEEYE